MNKNTYTNFLILVFLVSGLLAACQPADLEVAVNEVKVVETNTAVTMVDRIQFQDNLWEQNQFVDKEQPGTEAGITMADRIRFQDQLRAERSSGNKGLSLADRILFHDQLWEEKR